VLKRLLFHNFRLIFALDHWIRRRFTPAGLLALGGLVAAGVFGIDTRQTLAYQLFALLFTLLCVAFLSNLFFHVRLTAQRLLPKCVTIGEPICYQVRIYNLTRHLQQSLSLLEEIKLQSPHFAEFIKAKEPEQDRRNWFDNYVGYPRWLWLLYLSKGAEIPELSLPPLPPISQQRDLGLQTPVATMAYIEVTLTLTPLRRGYIHFTAMTFARPDPLGLVNALYTLPLDDHLLVLPKRYPVNQLALPGTRKYQPGGIHLAMSVGDAEEFVALREYRPGDPLRHIHWKSLAKLNKPVVKEFQDEFFVRHALILDTFTTETTNALFEAAVSIAASFVAMPYSHEVLLDLMFIGPQAYCFTGGRGIAQVDTLLEILACVQPCLDKPFSSLYPSVIEQAASLSGAICILLHWDDARRHLVQLLRDAGIPLLTIVVTEDPSTLTETTGIHLIPSNQIAQRLAQLESHELMNDKLAI